MSRFVAVDLSAMAAPDVVERLDYEAILAALKADAVARLAAVGITYNVGTLETDPVVVVLEAAAYREVLLRARVNDATRAIMLAYASRRDLEHRGVYYGVERRLVSPATDTEPAVYESDASLRLRVQLAPEAFASAGPEGAYQFHSLTVDPAIKDVAVLTPEPGHVHVILLTTSGNGVPSSTLIERVRFRLLAKDIKPLTDIITVRAPPVVNFTLAASLVIGTGPDRVLVVAAATAAVNAYLAARHRIGVPVTRSGLFASLHVAGVERVDLAQPTADVTPAADAVAYATSVTVTAQ